MKQPYQNAIDNNLAKFSQLGLSVLINTEDSIVFSDHTNRLEIGTERYSPLTLTFGIVGFDGYNRALLILERAIDPQMREAMGKRIKSATSGDNLSQKNYEEMLRDGSLERFLSLVIELQLEFLLAHKEEVFDPSDDTKRRYELQLKEVSQRLTSELEKRQP